MEEANEFEILKEGKAKIQPRIIMKLFWWVIFLPYIKTKIAQKMAASIPNVFVKISAFSTAPNRAR